MSKLTERGFDATGVDIVPNRWSDEVNAKTVIQDLRQSFDLGQSFDLVVHLAANARVHKLVVEPDLARDNILMTFNALEFARKSGTGRIIFAGSRGVYGETRDGLTPEDAPKVSQSPYIASKISSEALVECYQECYSVDFVITRFSNVYGRYDDKDRVVPLYIRKAIEDGDLVVYGENKVLDFTYLDDTVDGILRVTEQFDKVKNRALNVAGGEGVQLKYVAEKIIEHFGSGRLVVKENRTGEILRYVSDLTAARDALGYEPRVGIDEGVARSIDWYKNNLYSDLLEVRRSDPPP
jgi:UDP-glucose 4-epimerase